jgi:hypothetical protein
MAFRRGLKLVSVILYRKPKTENRKPKTENYAFPGFSQMPGILVPQ